MPRTPILLRVRSRGGATKIFFSGQRWLPDTLANAYVEAERSPQNEWERFGAPGRVGGEGEEEDEVRWGCECRLGVDRTGRRGYGVGCLIWHNRLGWREVEELPVGRSVDMVEEEVAS